MRYLFFDRVSFRFRLSTLMLLIIIAGLTSALLVEQQRRRKVEREVAVTRAQLPRYTVTWAQYQAAIKTIQRVPGSTSSKTGQIHDRASDGKAVRK
jgi:hypothetical protein